MLQFAQLPRSGEVRTCNMCGEAKTIDSYQKNGWRNGAQRYAYVCKECQNANDSARPVRKIVADRKIHNERLRLRKENRALADALAAAQKRVEITSASGVPIKIARRKPGRKEQAAAVLMCSDWHVEEPVRLEQTSGANEYTLEIADKRIKALASGFCERVELLRSDFSIKDAVIFLGGDLMSGHIHDDLMEASQISPVECVLWLQRRCLGLIDFVRKETGCTIAVPCAYGNHGRTTQKRRISTAAENSYEWLLYQQIAMHHAHTKGVSVYAPKSQLVYIDVLGQRMRFTHGDAPGTVPGILSAAGAWDKTQRAAVTCVGHFHTLQYYPQLVVNGSLVGAGPFGVSIGAAPEPPQQACFLMAERQGMTRMGAVVV